MIAFQASGTDSLYKDQYFNTFWFLKREKKKKKKNVTKIMTKRKKTDVQKEKNRHTKRKQDRHTKRKHDRHT